MRIFKKIEIFACVSILSLSMIAGSFNQANAATSRLVQFAFIGFGAAFISNYVQRDTCRSHRERIAGAVASGATAATLETVFTIGGGLMGLGNSGDLGGAAVGAIGGNILGKILGKTITRAGSARAGDAATRSRDFDAEFEYQTCLILQSSNVIRQHLVRHQLSASRENCAPTHDQNGRLTDEAFNQILYCGIRGNLSARTTNIHLIRLNQATCAAIQAVRLRLNTQAGSATGSIMPGPPTSNDVDCDNSAPQEIWRNFVRGRQ